MSFALLATVLFSFSAITGARMAKLMGGTEANFWRLALAVMFLAVPAHRYGPGLSGPAFHWFFASGCIGFGIGDVALFQAYKHLGPRLTVLIVHCLAAPFAGVVEWLWLGTTLTVTQMVCGGVVLAGVAVALAPERGGAERHGYARGIIFAAIAAISQGAGVVLSRKAYELCELAGQPMDGVTAAYQRLIGGVILSGLCLLVVKRKFILTGRDPDDPAPMVPEAEKWRRIWHLIVLNALFGPTFGVSCYQWALKTTPSAVVLPIVALSPLAVIPLARYLEHERQTARSLIGGLIAVAGAVALALASTR